MSESTPQRGEDIPNCPIARRLKSRFKQHGGDFTKLRAEILFGVEVLIQQSDALWGKENCTFALIKERLNKSENLNEFAEELVALLELTSAVRARLQRSIEPLTVERT